MGNFVHHLCNLLFVKTVILHKLLDFIDEYQNKLTTITTTTTTTTTQHPFTV